MRNALPPLLLIFFLVLQGGFWWHAHNLRPALNILPEVPGAAMVEALSLGDRQFLFRALALRLQHAGDTFGRFSPLRDYDYSRLFDWLTLLDTIDNTSDLMPTLAAYYYAQTQKTGDIRYIVEYLSAHAMHDPEKKWWWLVQAVYLANHKLHDKALALRVAAPLPKIAAAPVWARQMPAFIHEQRGEVTEALAIMEGIRKDADNLSDRELRFMRYFVEERLGNLERKLDEYRSLQDE